LRDLQAFAKAGCQPYLVRTGKGEETYNLADVPANTIVVADLAAAVQDIIAGDK
jgi:D-glycero-D-manno-heptose 1,7-bisphosphate phosphatase